MEKTTKSVLVTGGAGYIGSHVCKALFSSGYVPVTFDNLSRGFQWATRWGPFERGELKESKEVRNVICAHSPIGVIHLAGYAYVGESVEFPGLYQNNNVDNSQVLLEALIATGNEKIPIVFSSSCSVYGNQATTPLSEKLVPNPMNPYATGKLLIENMLTSAHQKFGTPFIALRYFNASGADKEGDIGEAHDPETHLIPLVLEVAAGLKKNITVFGIDHDTPDGSCVRDYVHVMDLAKAHVTALEYLMDNGKSRVLNLANGVGYSVFDVIEAVKQVTGTDITIINGKKREGDPAILIGDANLASAKLNWAPNYSDLDIQVAHAWKWFKSYYKLD